MQSPRQSWFRAPAFITSTLLCLYTGPPLCAQEGRAPTWTISHRIQGSSSSFGQIVKMNTNLAIDFNNRFGLDIGAPYFMVNYSTNETNTGSTFKSGIGNVYADFRLNAPGSALNYVSTLTVTAPTGAREKGLSTGHPTLDWNNGFYRVFANRISPYANIGIANTVSDTPFFLRPFSSSGIVGHFEGGATLSVSSLVAVGGSAYSIVPSGEQTIVSKVVEVHTETLPARTLPPNSRGRGLGLKRQPAVERIFETVTDVVGTADLASDDGFSTWVGIGPIQRMDLTVGYNHSRRYSLDSFFWGIGLRLRSFGGRVR